MSKPSTSGLRAAMRSSSWLATALPGSRSRITSVAQGARARSAAAVSAVRLRASLPVSAWLGVGSFSVGDRH